MESKYMEFFLIPTDKKTETWQISSKSSGYVLGHIKWYGAWRQYCFFPSPETVFNNSCLEDIRIFIDKLMEERKIKR